MTDEAKPETPDKQKEPKRTENWEEDQNERGYYYDDAHGYETFDPEKDGDKDEGEDDDDRSA